MKTIALTMPRSWNELSRKQLLFICRLYLSELPLQEFRIKSFLRFTKTKAFPQAIKEGGTRWFFRHKKQIFTLDNQQLNSFLKQCDYLTQDSELKVNHFSKVQLLFHCYYGPSDCCYNLSYLEFIHAEKCVYAYQKTRKQYYLNELCAVLYRPQKKNYNPKAPDYNGDRREAFNDFIYSRRAKRFHLVRLKKRLAIYLFYTGCRNHMMRSFPNLFKSETISSEPVNPVKSLRNIINDLNQGDPTRNEKLYQMQIWEAFEFLDLLIVKSKQAKKHGAI